MAQAPNVPSLYPTEQIQNDPYYLGFNINEIKKYQYPDCIKAYFTYFEMWTEKLRSEEKKRLLNRLLQDDEIAFQIYIENINEPYEVLKEKLIEQLNEIDEGLQKSRKEKRKEIRKFKRMSKEELQEHIRSTHQSLNNQPKERLVMRELIRSLPKKWNRKMDLEGKCANGNVDQLIEMLGEKFNKMKLKDRASKDGDKKPKKHPRRRRHASSSSSSSSNDTSGDEKCKKGGHHHGGYHHGGHHGDFKHYGDKKF